MKKILDNYRWIDENGYYIVAKKCNGWAKAGITNPAAVFGEIEEAGGQLGNGVAIGQHLIGNMYNHELGLSGEVWVTAKVTELKVDGNGGFLWAHTESGSSYLLLEEYAERSFMWVANRILAIAPEPLERYLEERISLWAPEIAWANLTGAVNRFVKPSSADLTSVAIYALLCDCTEEEMVRRFRVDGF